MCLLTFLPAGVMPDPAALHTGAELNRDGHGFAIVERGRLMVRHGLDGEEMVETFCSLRGQYRDGPAMFHSRFATHGERSLDNCHPFPVGGDSRTVIAHNGILPASVRPASPDPRSDTRIAAEEFLPRFGPLRLARVRRRVERWMTAANLMVVLTADRRSTQQAYLLNEQSGLWDRGIWYSNDGYRPDLHPRLAPGFPLEWDWSSWAELERVRGLSCCECCASIVDPTTAECPYCGWCQDCGLPPHNCHCPTPAELTRRLGRHGPSQA